MINKDYIVEIKNIYEGPMDLLLKLIKEEKIDIYDIPISHLTQRFIDTMDDINYDTLDDYLDFSVMAANLLEIKIRIILRDEEEDEEDPREDLVNRILEYNYYKKVSEILQSYYNIGKTGLEKYPEDMSILSQNMTIEYESLRASSLAKTLAQMLRKKHYREKDFTFDISVETYSVEESIESLEMILDREEVFYFSYLFDRGFEKGEIVTYFLAVLELSKMQEVCLEQIEEEIVVRKNDRRKN